MLHQYKKCPKCGETSKGTVILFCKTCHEEFCNHCAKGACPVCGSKGTSLIIGSIGETDLTLDDIDC